MNPDRQLNVPSHAPDPSGAEQVARAEVDRLYQAQSQPTQQQSTNPYQRTHQENFDWRNYHSAWQHYYQQYYERYYTQQLQVERDKQDAAQISEGVRTNEPVFGADPSVTQKTRAAQLKQDILNTIKTRARKVRRSNHFIPIASAVGIGLLFLFLQFNSVLFAQVQAYVSPGQISGDALLIDPVANVSVGPEPKLIIPKINVEVPVDYSVTGLSEAEIQTSLRDGATRYNLPGADALPGQYGNTVILGHSSNDIFNQGQYKFVFVLLDRLQPGDVFYLNYNSKRYIYKVTSTKVIDPTQISELQIGNSKPMATLITCTPPGTALKRLIIFGEQISPDPGTAAAATPSVPAQQSTSIPGNEPSWLDNVWNFFF